MRIAVMGAGAVGGYFGAKLAASHEVAFIARGDHLSAMQRRGLKIMSAGGDLHVREALFTAEPAAAGRVELVLFCVKSHATEAAAAALAPVIGPRTLILSLQNGVDNGEKIAVRYGAERTLPGVVYIGAQVTEPGVINHSSGGRIVFGGLSGPLPAGAGTVAPILTAAAIPCEISDDIAKAQWKKLLWNAPFCAISCLTRATVRDIVQSESLRKLALDCMTEVAAAARTRGVILEEELMQETIEFSKTLGDFKPSMLQDLEALKPLEFEAFNGVVLKLLRAAGVDAPTNTVFYGALQYLDKKIRAEARRDGQ
jgi:2-dehydropantoate 2-reductase